MQTQNQQSNSQSGKKEKIAIAVLTVLIAFMDVSGIPSIFLINLIVHDINPIYFALMFNFILIGLIAFLYLKLIVPGWRIGFEKKGFISGLKRYGPAGLAISIAGLIAFYLGVRPFDLHPSAAKVLVEGVLYYIGVALVEELYVRGLLLNLIDECLISKKNHTRIAVVLSSLIFGLGHIFGMFNNTWCVMAGRVLWTVCMGLFFGMVYKKTGNLWLVALFHFLINICALPVCFSSMPPYSMLTVIIMVISYLILGVWSLVQMKETA